MACSPLNLVSRSHWAQVGTQYCVGFMGLRLLDGSYRSGGKFFHEIEPAFRPAFSAKSYKGKEHFVFMLMSMMATAFMAHYNGQLPLIPL